MTFIEFQRLARPHTKTTIFKKYKKNNLRLIYLGKIAIFANTNGCYICL